MPLLSGPLSEPPAPWPLLLWARLGDLRPRFLPKGRAGRGWRAVARNGRVLLASDVPVEELTGRGAAVRVQTWHKAVLPGDEPKPYGVLLCVRVADAPTGAKCLEARLEREPGGNVPLALDVGGETVLTFREA